MDKPEALHTGHRERMKQKYTVHGLDVFEAHEVLEMVLYYAVPRRDVNGLAHTILDRFDGRLDRVLAASLAELELIPGVSHNTALLIHLFNDVTNRAEREHQSSVKFLNSFDDIGAYLKPYFQNTDHELFMVLAMDGKKKVLFCRKMCEGSRTSTELNLRAVVRALTLSDASMAVIAHNHPSGNAMPSDDDIRTTGKLADLLAPFGILLVDHMIFADNDYISFFQSRILLSSFLGANLFRDGTVPTDNQDY